ncbi:MAG TPA: HlyD family secretion protein [Cytophagaceae bacterium]|nr:HlyD family secretion protein [Cytophagaceae bacterium]
METEEKKPKKSKRILFVLIPVLLLVAAYIFKSVRHAIKYESTDNAQVESNAVPVLSRVAGYVDSLPLQDYQDIKAGQLLLSIDEDEYRIAVQQAEADLATAQADLANAQAQLVNTGANRNVATANAEVQNVRLQKALSDLKRDEALYKEGSITQKQYDDSKSNVETAQKMYLANQQQVTQASSQSAISQAQVTRANAAIDTRKAMLEQAKLRFSYTKIYAPISGRIGKKNLEKGQYIQPGQPLFNIVNNEKFWIIANFKETQLYNMKIGQAVEIKIDGYPDRKIMGKITAFSDATGAKFALLPPDNATGNFVKVTQRVPVKIDFDNLSEIKDILKAGLSVEIDVEVK